MDLPDIKADFQKLMQSKIGGKKLQNNLRASSIGFDCDRHHFYALTEPREPHNWELQSIFDEGNLHEKAIEKTMREMGYEVNDAQKEYRLEKPLITMHIDGKFRGNGTPWFAFDSKSINPWDYDKLESAEDFIHSKKPHQRNYPTQLLLYMYAMSEEYGCLILKNKQTGQIKPIWFSWEQHFSLVDEAIKRAERVYAAFNKKEPPARTTDRSLCENCAFKEVCIPDLLAEGGIEFLNSPELMSKLERRDELKDLAKEFNDLDDEVKEVIKKTGVGEKSIGDYLAQVSEVKTTRKVPITWDEEPNSYLKIKIVKL